MSQKVGQIYYDVTLETGTMIEGSRKAKKELNGMGEAGSALTAKLSQVSRAIGVMATAMAAIKSLNMADEMRLLGVKVEVAAGSMQAGASAMAELEAISRRTGTSVAANAEVFTRLNQSLLQMGGTQEDTLRVTETLSKAIRVSGANAVEAKTAMVQFGQAMGSGKLAGDELKSMLESAPYLMRKLAEGIGVPVGALKKLGEEGKLTSDVVANALSKAAASIDADFQKFPQTIASAMDVALDAAARANFQLDELAGTSTTLTGVVKGTGEAFDELARQLSMVNDKSGELSKNDIIKQWANGSRVAMSYLIDAADVVWQTISVLGRNVAYVLKSTGAEIGGIGAQISAVMRGDFAGAKAIGDAMEADSEARRAALDAADKKTLGRAQTMGAAMRAAWDQKKIEDRGFTPSLNAGKIVAPAGDSGKAKPAKLTLAEKYTEQLQKQLEKEQELTTVQQLGMDINAGRLGKLTAAQQNALVALAQKVDAEKAENELQKEGKKLNEDAIKQSEEYDKTQLERTVSLYESNAALRLHGQEIGLTKKELNALELARIDDAIAIEQQGLAEAQNGSATEKEIDGIRRHIKALRERKAVTASNQIAQAAADTSKEQQDAAKRFADDLHGDVKNALSSAFRDTKDPISAFGDALGNVIYTRVANSLADAMLTSNVGSSVMSGLTSLFSFGGGRAYGGPANSGSLYRVNEKGAPEMFTASNGSQYMMPTKSGRVTAADKVGGGGGTTVINITASVGDIASKSDVIKGMRATASQIAAQISRSKNYGGAMS